MCRGGGAGAKRSPLAAAGSWAAEHRCVFRAGAGAGERAAQQGGTHLFLDCGRILEYSGKPTQIRGEQEPEKQASPDSIVCVSLPLCDHELWI